MKRLIVLACLTCFISAHAQNVGIGTTTPSEKLDVNGNVKISGYLNFNGNTGLNGQVLTSQGTNPPIWKTVPGTKLTDFTPVLYSQASAELFTGDIVLKSTTVADKWYDGVGLASFGDSLFVFGGWYTSGATGSIVTNQIRYSTDEGTTWVLSSAVLPFSGHTFVYFKSPDGWLYIIGADNFNIQNVQTVWRTRDMQNFTVMTTAAGWGNRTLMGGWADEDANIYIAGGQNSTNVATGPNDIWMSADGGANWSQIINNINVNGEYFLGQNVCNQVKYFNKRVYVVGGGISAAVPDDTYSKKVYSASINDLSKWRKENDLPYTNGRRYANVEVWDGKLWVWSGNNSAEGNLKTLCYMDNSGVWHDFKYTYTGNNPANQVSTTHAAGITVHKDMLYRVLGNVCNDAYALKRSSYVANMNVRDTFTTKNIIISSLAGTGTRVTIASPGGELKSSDILETDLLTLSGLSGKAISNQVATAQAASLWIAGRGLFGGGTDMGKTFQVNGDSYVSGLAGIGTSSPATYLAGVTGLTVYNPTNAGISFANANKYWMTWINNSDLKFFEGGAGINRLTLKAGGTVNIQDLSGTGTRMVVADATGNLSTQTINSAGETNTASNLGNTTFGLFKQKVGADLQFRSITIPADGGIELISNTNDVQIKNNAFAVYGKVETTTADATADVLIKKITPASNSAGTLEVDMAAVSNSLGSITGKKYIRYKKSATAVTLIALTDAENTVGDGDITAASWTVTANSGDLEIRVTGTPANIKWRSVYQLNQVTAGP
ncbi:MAG: hypothetical protein ABI741_02890 [Ferruginibacter sp.]